MNLSNEDSLRLHVMLRQQPRAIRIDDSKMIVHALTRQGEATITLNPTCREEKYLKLVRELLSTHVMGSPGGYPVYIRRWTRMGQQRDDSSLRNLLLLGEPEAVTAVVNTPGISAELAELAWWAQPTAEIARQLLRSPHVVAAPLGKELADFLIEFLPFEDNHQLSIDSVRLALQPGLLDDKTIATLWRKARRRQSYYIGFLHALPDSLPDQRPPHPLHATAEKALEHSDTAETQILLRALSAPGQTFLHTAAAILPKLPNQDATIELLEAIGAYFNTIRPDTHQYRDFDTIRTRAAEILEQHNPLGETASEHPRLNDMLNACLQLSLVNEYLAAPIFGRTDAIGSVMRKRLQPITDPLAQNLQQLTT